MTIAAAIAAGSSLLSGFQAFRQAQYSAAVASANKQTAKANAEHAVSVGQTEAQDIGEENAGRQGQGIARMGSSGLALTSPSFAQAQSRNRALNVEEQDRTVEAAYRRAANFETQADEFGAEAKASKTAGSLALVGSFLGAAAGLARADANSIRTTGQPLDLLRRKDRTSNWFNFGSGFSTGY